MKVHEKKTNIMGKNIFLKIHQKLHEFSGIKNQPGIRKKKTRKFLLGKRGSNPKKF